MMNIIQQFKHLKIPLEDIKSATNNFADDKCIGRGGFGKVYMGALVRSNGQTIKVALKRLDPAFGQGDPEFWKEIVMLSIYEHVNIVSLIGFCDENDEKILVYEFASQKSLHLYLSNDDLTWVRRLHICIGAARGLECLHGEAETKQRVLHCDIKSSNILLDENWNAKISDFGLSKFAPANQPLTILFSNVVGTPGYCDPLYAETGLLTKESDVYSFGVVLFEVLCGRLCIRDENDWQRPFPLLVRKCYEENKIIDIIYDKMKDEININSLNEFTSIAYQCLKHDREERPLMKEIVTRLEIALEYQVPFQGNQPAVPIPVDASPLYPPLSADSSSVSAISPNEPPPKLSLAPKKDRCSALGLCNNLRWHDTQKHRMSCKRHPSIQVPVGRKEKWKRKVKVILDWMRCKHN